MNPIHGSAVAIGDAGVLLLGASGSGKSDLALRLIADGAHLVADDQVMLAAISGGLWAAAPASIAGLIEVRGLGIRRMPHRQAVRLALVIELNESVERLPEPVTRVFLGVTLKSVALAPFEQSAAIKVRLALRPGLAADWRPMNGGYT